MGAVITSRFGLIGLLAILAAAIASSHSYGADTITTTSVPSDA